MRILLIGANGQLGFELWRNLQLQQEVVPTTRDGQEVSGMNTLGLDLADATDIELKLKNIKPDIICNAAAFTAVDAAESEQQQAELINQEAVAKLAHYAHKHESLLVHYSTDYVFSGQGEDAWTEKDETDPLSVYGQTKLAGEQAIEQSGCEFLILRTAWVFAERGHNFLRTMLRLAQERDEISVVNDQAGTPTWAHTLAIATAAALYLPQTGIYHVTNAGSTTWFGFAKHIFEQAEKLGLLQQQPKLTPIASDAYPTAAPRPKNSVLNCEKFEKIFNVKLPHWTTAMQLCMQRMKS